tara:strand:- start:807 stop:1043 length:237 start_codon:yes stop_codon:yes gene_type:complete
MSNGGWDKRQWEALQDVITRDGAGPFYLGVATVTSPYMRSYRAAYPFNEDTSFILPDREDTDPNTAVVNTRSFIKAKP